MLKYHSYGWSASSSFRTRPNCLSLLTHRHMGLLDNHISIKSDTSSGKTGKEATACYDRGGQGTWDQESLARLSSIALKPLAL